MSCVGWLLLHGWDTPDLLVEEPPNWAWRSPPFSRPAVREVLPAEMPITAAANVVALALLGTVLAKETCDPFESFALHPATKGGHARPTAIPAPSA